MRTLIFNYWILLNISLAANHLFPISFRASSFVIRGGNHLSFNRQQQISNPILPSNLVLTMSRGVKKQDLPTKICVTCNRPFTWRKKWERNWDEITTCSKRCNSERRLAKKKDKNTMIEGEGDSAEGSGDSIASDSGDGGARSKNMENKRKKKEKRGRRS